MGAALASGEVFATEGAVEVEPLPGIGLDYCQQPLPNERLTQTQDQVLGAKAELDQALPQEPNALKNAAAADVLGADLLGVTGVVGAVCSRAQDFAVVAKPSGRLGFQPVRDYAHDLRGDVGAQAELLAAELVGELDALAAEVGLLLPDRGAFDHRRADELITPTLI